MGWSLQRRRVRQPLALYAGEPAQTRGRHAFAVVAPAAEARGRLGRRAGPEEAEGAAAEGEVIRRGILLAVGRRGESHKAVVAQFQARWTSSRGPRDTLPPERGRRRPGTDRR